MDELDYIPMDEFDPTGDPTEEELEYNAELQDEYDAEMDRDMLLEQQELDDLENFYGPTDGPYDDGGEW
jgi:hypothetical protein